MPTGSLLRPWRNLRRGPQIRCRFERWFDYGAHARHFHREGRCGLGDLLSGLLLDLVLKLDQDRGNSRDKGRTVGFTRNAFK
jgi:hypothetical protein